MMDIEKLIDRLGENTDCWTDKVHGYADLRLDAATALSALQAELDVMTQRNDENLGMCRIWERRYSELQAENEKLRAELEQVKKKNKYSAHDVALILSDAFGDSCACNFNGNDEWLPEKCELLDICPDVVGVACWEQYLKWRGQKED